MLGMSGIPGAVKLLTELIPLALSGLVSALKEGLPLEDTTLIINLVRTACGNFKQTQPDPLNRLLRANYKK